MGLPKFDISFQTSAIGEIGLAGKGLVALLLKDATASSGTVKVFKNLAEVNASEYDADSYLIIEEVFKGSPLRVKVVTATEAEDFSAIQALVLQGTPDVDYMVAPEFSADFTAMISFITTARSTGAKVKGVFGTTGSDLEYIVDIKVSGCKDINGNSLSNQDARVGGILAGLSPSRSATYFVIPEVVETEAHVDIDAEIDTGHLVYLNDGSKVKIARGVNSFTSFTPEKGELFSKIKNVETMDEIRYSVRRVVEDDYVGKYTNSLDNKNLVLVAINQYLKTLADNNYLNPSFNNECILDLQEHLDYAERNGVDTTGFNETEIKKIDTGDNLYLIINCRLLDTIEDVTIKVYL